ncbi:hypothetical protein RhiirA5_373395 [Rhizophagus irregularis]|uniref:Uncharacterized protein n=1 Tax=Rhizophagus irregularis TaxID=588596 RepID=A0A2N0PYX4_9GLOM|nr:hypothetical protein RhiirA5_373395 [Rhizophagus irregularis]CAB5181209.1 unnamed protein product [Rhizophagus irregularis]
MSHRNNVVLSSTSVEKITHALYVIKNVEHKIKSIVFQGNVAVLNYGRNARITIPLSANVSSHLISTNDLNDMNLETENLKNLIDEKNCEIKNLKEEIIILNSKTQKTAPETFNKFILGLNNCNKIENSREESDDNDDNAGDKNDDSDSESENNDENELENDDEKEDEENEDVNEHELGENDNYNENDVDNDGDETDDEKNKSQAKKEKYMKNLAKNIKRFISLKEATNNSQQQTFEITTSITSTQIAISDINDLESSIIQWKQKEEQLVSLKRVVNVFTLIHVVDILRLYEAVKENQDQIQRISKYKTKKRNNTKGWIIRYLADKLAYSSRQISRYLTAARRLKTLNDEGINYDTLVLSKCFLSDFWCKKHDYQIFLDELGITLSPITII